MKKAQQLCGTLFCILVLVVVPLFFENKYLDMLQAKAHAYNVILLLAAATVVVIGIAAISHSIRNKEKNNTASFWKFSLFDIGMLVLFIAPLISSLINNSWSESLWGMNGFCVGVVMICLTTVMCVVLPRFYKYNHNIMILVMIVNVAIGLIAALHAAGVDVFGMHDNLVQSQYYGYMSTLGNNNWAVGYLCMFIMLFAAMFLNSTKKTSSAMYLVTEVFLFIYGILCGSDGIFLGLGVAFLFAIPFAFSDGQRFRRLFILTGIFGICMGLICILPCYTAKMTTYGGFFEHLMTPVPIICIIVVSAVLVVLGRPYGKISEKSRKIVIKCVIAAFCAAAAFLVVYTIVTFNDSWGTERGLIWRYCVQEFEKFSLTQKLFGVGPEMFGYYMNDLADYFGMSIYSAHSEPIQVIFTMGILGLAGWIVVWIAVFMSYFKNRIWEKEYVALFLPIAAYFGQSLVNGMMATNVAVICVMMIFYRSFIIKNGYEPGRICNKH